MSLNLGPLSDCEGRLQRDFVEFARLWAAVREDWLDDQCRRFEKDHLQSLGPSLNRFVAALHELNDVVRKADLQMKDDQNSEQELE